MSVTEIHQDKPESGKATFTALFVRRPILALVFNTLMVVAGLAAYVGVEVRELPDVDRPVVTVRTTFDGASPQTIDQELFAAQVKMRALAVLRSARMQLCVVVARCVDI